MGVLMLLFVQLLFVACGFRNPAEVSADGEQKKRMSEMRGPGFIYTRTPGRCTPQFWCSGREPWPKMVPEGSSVSRIFGSRTLERYEPQLTLLEATQRNDEIGGSPFSKLVKQSSAALLNAYVREGFPYTAWEVKSMFLEAIVSEEAAAAQADRFEQLNNLCS